MPVCVCVGGGHSCSVCLRCFVYFMQKVSRSVCLAVLRSEFLCVCRSVCICGCDYARRAKGHCVFFQSQCVAAMQSDAYFSDQCQSSAGEVGWVGGKRFGGDFTTPVSTLIWDTHLCLLVFSYFICLSVTRSLFLSFFCSLTHLFLLFLLTPSPMRNLIPTLTLACLLLLLLLSFY